MAVEGLDLPQAYLPKSADTILFSHQADFARRESKLARKRRKVLPSKRAMLSCRRMNVVQETDPQKIRPLVHEKVDQLSDSELAEVHRQLVILEAKRELQRLRAEVGKEWDERGITDEKVAETIAQYRATHPYRTPDRP
jgi:hypothetical protein